MKWKAKVWLIMPYPKELDYTWISQGADYIKKDG